MDNNKKNNTDVHTSRICIVYYLYLYMKSIKRETRTGVKQRAWKKKNEKKTGLMRTRYDTAEASSHDRTKGTTPERQEVKDSRINDPNM